MIGKIADRRKDGGSSFFSLAKYILHGDDGDIRVVYANTRNTFCELDDNDEWAWQTVAAEMNALGTANVRCADPVFHFILSFRPEEVPTTAQVDDAVEIALKELNLEKCKSLYGLQNDNGIHHIHVCTCRIDPETERAVKPAGGWTKKALTKAARKIELAQGWEILRDDPFWDVTDDGQVVKKSYAPHDEKPRLDSNAKDLEAHMGEKSAQRIAVERGSEIIRNSRSWQELHEKLGDVGLRFERKGSGAVIFVGDEAVKASVIGRDCSMSKLEARLGVFQESEIAIVKNIPLTPEPTEQTETTAETLSAWERYQEYRKDYSELKKEKYAEFMEHVKPERDEFKKRQAAERKQMFQTNWKGRGKELNLQRNLLAGKQLQERMFFYEREREKNDAAFALPQFLSYREWLAENDKERIDELRKWKPPTVLVLENAKPTVGFLAPLKLSIPRFYDYEQKARWDGSVSYSLPSNSSKKEPVAFTDKGKEIDVYKTDESAVLAAMKLAQQKWRNVKITGNDEYVKLCIRLAEKNHICIQVPKEYEHLKKIPLVDPRTKGILKPPLPQPIAPTTSPQQDGMETGVRYGTNETDGNIPPQTQNIKQQEPKTEPPENISAPASAPTPAALAMQTAKKKYRGEKVSSAVPEKSYEGKILEKRNEHLVMQSGWKEITIVPIEGLKSVPKVGDNVKISALRDDKRVVAKSRESLGR